VAQALLADERARVRRKPWTWRPKQIYLPLPLLLVWWLLRRLWEFVMRVRTPVRLS